MLLQFALNQRAGILGGLGERRQPVRGRTPFNRRFAEHAQDLVLRAQEICREIGSAEVTPAHVLLAMLEDDVLRPTLERRGITEEAVRAVLPSGPPRIGHAPISTRRGGCSSWRCCNRWVSLDPTSPAILIVVCPNRANPCVLRPRLTDRSSGWSRSPRRTATGYARRPSASGTSTATRTWRHSGLTAGSTWRSRRRRRFRS